MKTQRQLGTSVPAVIYLSIAVALMVAGLIVVGARAVSAFTPQPQRVPVVEEMVIRPPVSAKAPRTTSVASAEPKR
jgi:hypothetical protein